MKVGRFKLAGYSKRQREASGKPASPAFMAEDLEVMGVAVGGGSELDNPERLEVLLKNILFDTVIMASRSVTHGKLFFQNTEPPPRRQLTVRVRDAPASRSSTTREVREDHVQQAHIRVIDDEEAGLA